MNIHPSVFEEATMVYIDPDTEVVFVWGGGYVDAGHFGTDGQFVAVECIDFPASDGYGNGRTLREFQEVCTAFLAGGDDDDDESEDDDDDSCGSCGGACTV